MDPKLLYHITYYRNLRSILQKGELLAHTKVESNRLTFEDIAHSHIQNKRSNTRVEVSPYGMLHDYVPFYFAPRSPMLYAIKNGSVEGFEGTQSDIIYLVTNTNKIVEVKKKFVFTDGHAIMALTEFYNDLSDLNEVDWSVMESKYWNDTDEFPDRKRRRQAEFLVYESVPVEKFLGIAVYNERIKLEVEAILNEYEVKMHVLERPNFYF